VQFVVYARPPFPNLIFVFQFTINFILMIVIKNIFLRHRDRKFHGGARIAGRWSGKWAVWRPLKRRRMAKKLALRWMRNEKQHEIRGASQCKF